MISGRINTKKINKDRIYVGQKGSYLDFVLIETPNSQYGDYMIVQSVSKDERLAGKKGEIIGNAKILVKKNDDELNGYM